VKYELGSAPPGSGGGSCGGALPHHRGTIHFETRVGEIEAAFADAAAGRPSSRPIIEMTIPTALDASLAPPGKHVALLFCQYAPHTLAGGRSWDDVPGSRDAFADSVFRVVEEHAPGFTASVRHRDILAPPDLEATFGLPVSARGWGGEG
jgi:phytoene dehydrogenase-like protein